jgi:hypothetical protein
MFNIGLLINRVIYKFFLVINKNLYFKKTLFLFNFNQMSNFLMYKQYVNMLFIQNKDKVFINKFFYFFKNLLFNRFIFFFIKILNNNTTKFINIIDQFIVLFNFKFLKFLVNCNIFTKNTFKDVNFQVIFIKYYIQYFILYFNYIF